MTKKATMTIARYARERGVTAAAVYKAIDEHKLLNSLSQSQGGHLRINPELAEKEWPRPAVPPERDPAFDLVGDGDDDEKEVVPLPDGVPHLHASRATREHWLARQAQLDYEKAQGKLLDRDDVRRTVFALARKARDAMISIPERTAAILAATTDEREVLNILLREINRVCDEIARGAEAPVEPVVTVQEDAGLDDI
jgi:hypothetical protein